MRNLKRGIVAVGAIAMLTSTVGGAVGSSHREAPFTEENPELDLTDLYAWRTAGDTVTFVMNSWPLEEPMGGPEFFQFGDELLYDINIDNDADAKRDVTFRFDFRSTVANPGTFLYNTGPVTSATDADLAVRQTYTVDKIEWENDRTVRSRTRLGSGIPVPPVNVGAPSTPDYESIAMQSVRSLRGGDFKTFAGQRDDPFALDLRVFNLLYGADLSQVGDDTLRGFNVQSIVFEAPVAELTAGNDPVIGIWSNIWRQSTQVLNTNGTQSYEGPYVQVSRLGNPLVNEVVIPRPLKDYFNASRPLQDNIPAVANLVLEPELAKLLNAVYDIDAPEENRQDLLAIFLTGFELPDGTNVNKPRGRITPAEMLRLNTDIEPCTADRADDDAGRCQRLGVLGGDLAGFPNGRRLTDDVVDIEIKAVAGATYKIFVDPDFDSTTAMTLGDGVDRNDRPFKRAFPYVASPNGGAQHGHHRAR